MSEKFPSFSSKNRNISNQHEEKATFRKLLVIKDVANTFSLKQTRINVYLCFFHCFGNDCTSYFVFFFVAAVSWLLLSPFRLRGFCCHRFDCAAFADIFANKCGFHLSRCEKITFIETSNNVLIINQPKNIVCLRHLWLFSRLTAKNVVTFDTIFHCFVLTDTIPKHVNVFIWQTISVSRDALITRCDRFVCVFCVCFGLSLVYLFWVDFRWRWGHPYAVIFQWWLHQLTSDMIAKYRTKQQQHLRLPLDFTKMFFFLCRDFFFRPAR